MRGRGILWAWEREEKQWGIYILHQRRQVDTTNTTSDIVPAGSGIPATELPRCSYASRGISESAPKLPMTYANRYVNGVDCPPKNTSSPHLELMVTCAHTPVSELGGPHSPRESTPSRLPRL